MSLVCLQAPTVEPVSLSELKEMLRLNPADTGQDATIQGLAIAARAWCENFTRRPFVLQQWRMQCDFFPGYIQGLIPGQAVSSPIVSGGNAVVAGLRYAMILPKPPVRSIDLFQFQDGNGGNVVMAEPANYTSDLASQPARLTPPFGQFWPVARVIPNAVQVDFTVGYATPIVGTITQGQSVFQSAYAFQASDVGRPISIPGAGANGGALNTIVASLSNTPPVVTLATAAATTVTNGTALLVNYGNPAHWELIRTAIKVLTNGRFVQRLPAADLEENVKALLYPVVDPRH